MPIGAATIVDGDFPDRLVKAARRFQLPALWRVLRWLGYAAESVFFESVRGASAWPGLVGPVPLLRMRPPSPDSSSR